MHDNATMLIRAKAEVTTVDYKPRGSSQHFAVPDFAWGTEELTAKLSAVATLAMFGTLADALATVAS